MKKVLKIIFASVAVSLLLISSVIVIIRDYQNKFSLLFQKKQSEENVVVEALNGMPPWVTEEIIVTCLEIQEKYGIYASVTIAQAEQEVGGTWDGTSLYNTASKEFNLFGLKVKGGLCTWEGEITWDGAKGATGTYRKYNSYAQGLKDRARLLMTSPVYADIAKTAQERSGSQSQLEALSKSPWCENQYNTLNRFMTKYNLKRLDTMTVSSFEWDPSMGAGGGGSFSGTFAYYNQGDPRWGHLPYVRGSTIQKSGCAACCLAMIWATYSKDSSISPPTIFPLGHSNGALVDGWLSRGGCVSATNRNPKFGCTAVHVNGNNWNQALKALDKGGAVMVVGTGNPPFTQGGHWFVIIGYKGNTAYLADPGHRACTWTKIGGQSNGESLSYIKSRTQDMIIFTPR